MERITHKKIYAFVERLQQAGIDIGCDSAYGQIGITNRAESAILCHRTKSSEIYHWLLGFVAGAKLGVF